MDGQNIRVLVVDDHEMVRLGITSFLETEPCVSVVGEARSGREALKQARELCPDVILMDLLMEDMDGIAATRAILHDCPDTKVIVLTSYVDDELVYPALEAGAVSYLLKTANAEEVARAVQAAVRGESVVDPKVMKKLVHRIHRQKPLHASLTDRELEVLMLIAEGKTNQDIADTLHIGLKTVKTHVSNILSKLEVDDRTQAAVYAHRHGLVNDSSR